MFNNKHFVTILTLLIALYVSFVAPKLPDALINLFGEQELKAKHLAFFKKFLVQLILIKDFLRKIFLHQLHM